jgi:exodeoxyribonuclease-5
MMLDALHQTDSIARRLALTALDRTLLVEAGAGSGKTSILAGRVTSLLAAGRPPGTIAAITFTEVAAGELRERVSTFVAEVAGGFVRPDLRAGFPDGPSVAQRHALIQARDSLDQLTCSTIHGFCQVLLTPYPVEAGMDPGAAIMDASAAKALFSETLEAWLRERLSGERKPDDLLVALYVANPSKTDALLRRLGARLLRHRSARVLDTDRLDDALGALREAVMAFNDWLAQAGCHEADTATIVSELKALVNAAPGSGASEIETLIHLLWLAPPPSCLRKTDGGYLVYQKAGKWRAAAKGILSVMAANQLKERAAACYVACAEAHLAAKSYAAGRILQLLAADLRQVLDRFKYAKRDAALIDFDDLLVKARDLLAEQPAVRRALGDRFTTVLVDEFQDTDPLQCEILWRLCGEAPNSATHWTENKLRPGALFLVGDPKQAIYRFRGADVSCYVDARTRLLAEDGCARVVIGQNFRSLGEILEWVNARFEAPLSLPSQPGFEALFTRVEYLAEHVPVAALPVTIPEGGKADQIRDAEAEAVAAFCARIIGALPVRGREGIRLCRPDDIALLAPGGKELWRYERALEDKGIAVSTQAGKGFYRRQEVQDLIALTRVLADARDTLALGALLRGPLVGLTEEQLLDAAGRLPVDEEGRSRLYLWTPIEQIAPPLLRETLEILQTLAKHARGTTPYVLLSQAVEELRVRPLLRQRQDRTAERALANVDLFLEGARAYDMRGLVAFAAAMRAQWADAQRVIEGRPDTEQQSVSLVTMHSSKGLEWPVVIPVNTGTKVINGVDAVVDASGILHLAVFGQHGPGAAAALVAEQAEIERERHRLWYVVATRARDLLLLPRFSCGVPAGSWMQAFPLGLEDLPPIDVATLGESSLFRTEDVANGQDRARFETEAALIAARTDRIVRVTPHLAEAGEENPISPSTLPRDADGENVQQPLPRGSLARGRVLHKLLEEVLAGETMEDAEALRDRAIILVGELKGTPGAAEFDAVEAARSVLRGLRSPNIQTVRDRLIPEYWVARCIMADEIEQATMGVADAILRDPSGRISLVVDWKSDVNPENTTIEQYRSQVGAYLQATGAKKGIIVFLTNGLVEDVKPTRSSAAG